MLILSLTSSSSSWHHQQLPNTVGFLFGIVQMMLYIFYKKANSVLVLEEPKLHVPEHIIDAVKLTTLVCPELNSMVSLSNGNGNQIIIEKEKAQESKTDMDG
jgi:solute carrier family 50 protein (sugar transporter)